MVYEASLIESELILYPSAFVYLLAINIQLLLQLGLLCNLR